eukprot:m.10972 g.10972  ORF g.10972 m.10972 type:complete len:81 (+) comp7529_c0_seq1:727-969(+)
MLHPWKLAWWYRLMNNNLRTRLLNRSNTPQRLTIKTKAGRTAAMLRPSTACAMNERNCEAQATVKDLRETSTFQFDSCVC